MSIMEVEMGEHLVGMCWNSYLHLPKVQTKLFLFTLE